MKIKKLLLCCLFSLFAAALYSQNNTPPENITPLQAGSAEEDEPENGQTTRRSSATPEDRRIEMEIKTSTIPELAAWCRSLGLSESGTRAELSRRLRLHFGLPEPSSTAGSNRKVITIESAQVSEYFKIEVTDEEYARLSGDVRLSMIDNDTIHKISAEEILFNRTRNMLTARGNVVYEQDKAGTIEIFRGEKITVNIDDWTSVFLDGNSERRLESDGTAYRFEGTVISRSGEDVTVLTKARITNANNEEALWSINASKIWLLPGSDFAIFNAVLRVGEIPLFYLPFFYFPADEMIFHPVIGYRSREGGFAQTTFYIFGRPKVNAADTSSLTRILGNSNEMEKERQGLFLRSTGRKVADPDTLSLKALLDYYVNMGTYLGAELYVPKTGIINSTELSMGLGFTRTVSLTGMGYTPFAPDYDGTSDWNRSSFISLSVPFRYRFDLKGSINSPSSSHPGSFTWNLPYYSDPYVDIDFMNRSESMDWFNMLQQSSAPGTTENEIGTYQWHISGHLTPSFPSLSPYISRITVSSLSTTLTFNTFNNSSFSANSFSPERKFYAPSTYTIYNLSASVSGTPYTLSTNMSSIDPAVPQIDDPLGGIGTPVSPWAENNNTASSGEGSSEEKLVPPVLTQRFEIPSAGDIKFSIDYLISPTSTSALQFMSKDWKTNEDVDWNDVLSVLSSFGGNGNLNFRLDQSKGLFSNVFTFSGRTTLRHINFLNEENYRDPVTEIIDDNAMNTFRRTQYSQTNYSASYSYDGRFRPLYRNEIFDQSNLQYSFGGTLVRSRRYNDGDGPELSPHWGAWAKNEDLIPGLTAHRLAANLAVNIMDKRQNATVSFTLPPLDPLISFDTVIRFWISETKADFSIKQEPDTGEWVYNPFRFTEILTFNNRSNLTYYMVFDPQTNNEITAITSTLNFYDITAGFKMLKTHQLNFAPNNPSAPYLGGKWEQYGEPVLIPAELSFGYKRLFLNKEIIKNRMGFSADVNSAVTFNFLENTKSNFQFTMGFNLGITGFMDIKLSATSANAVIWRYFKGVPGMGNLTSMYMDGPQNNVFTDLFDSFNFSNNTVRSRSGFKMKSFNLDIIHYLGDWRAEFGIAMKPNTSNTASGNRITTDINFLVQWIPISEIKTNPTYDGALDRWFRN